MGYDPSLFEMVGLIVVAVACLWVGSRAGKAVEARWRARTGENYGPSRGEIAGAAAACVVGIGLLIVVTGMKLY
jgi:hypothetical protein